MNLNCSAVPAGKLTVTFQSGFEDVYELADNATAFAVFQFPIAALFPTSLIVCPNCVVARTLKVTATEVAVAQLVVVVVLAADVLEVETLL